MTKMRNINELINERAKMYNEKVFLISPEEGTLTYRDLDINVKGVMKFLINLNIKKGDNIAIFMHNGIDFVKSFLGIISIGAIVIPINIRLRERDIKFLLKDSETKIVIADLSINEEMERVAKYLNIKIINKDEIIKNELDIEEDFNILKDDVAVILYTSGTTGDPKGVMLTHNNLITSAKNVIVGHELTENDVSLCVLPLYHISAEVLSLITPLCSGGSVIMPNKFSATNFWEIASKYKATWVPVVPTILAILLAKGLYEKNLDLSNLKFGRSASGPLSIDLNKRFEEIFKIPILETYGLTESTSQVVTNPRDLSKRKYGSVGIPVGCKLKIIDENGKEVKPFQFGEILIKGENVTKGYFRNEELTKKFIIDGWLYTGDIGYKDEDGYYYIKGRKNDIINKGGMKISPRDVEEVICTHPKVLECACVGVPDSIYYQEVKVFIVLKENVKCNKEEIINFCKKNLADYKCPKYIEFIGKIPKGTSGKIIRKKLLEL